MNAWRRSWSFLALAIALGGCGYVSFGRKVTDDEHRLQQEVRSYYNDIQEAFAAGNPDRLAALFAPSITHPMTQPEILAWGKKFFSENKNAHFRIDKLAFDELSYVRAVVTLTYKVETPGGKNDFGGTERDVLTQAHGHWYTESWDKLQ